jgi:hypothetical protein
MMRELMDGTIHLMLTITDGQQYHALEGPEDANMRKALKPCAYCGLKLLSTDLPTHQQNCLHYMQTKHKQSQPPAPTTAKLKHKRRGRGDNKKKTSNPRRFTTTSADNNQSHTAKCCSPDPASPRQQVTSSTYTSSTLSPGRVGDVDSHAHHTP